MRYYSPQYRRRQTALEMAEARARKWRGRVREPASDSKTDTGDFDDMGRAVEANRYHADQKHRRGTL